MDSLTQLVLGSAISGAIAHKQLGRSALVIGAVLATLPDLDILIPATDAVTRFTEHRSFSHSLFVLFPFSFVCFALLRLTFSSQQISTLRLFGVCCLTLTTHPLLDAFTSYGTQLFWPLTVPPIAIASIFAVDPLYTLPLLIGCIALWRNKNTINAHYINNVGLVLSSCYLLIGLALQTLTLKKVENTLQARHIQQDKIFISPLYPSLNWWGAIVVANGIYYDVTANVITQSINVSIQHDLGHHLIEKPNKALRSLQWFTDDFLRLQEVNEQLVVTDLRMKTGQLGYAFKFVLAEKKAKQWSPVVPFRL